ncbi:MAG TPA: hypothetical protein VEP90_23120, partial [Methylomirabilota bacterium]|nr:hypothetical protein [Methylomirabilota bacterium]
SFVSYYLAREPGGQPGHAGRRLQVAKTDEIVYHRPADVCVFPSTNRSKGLRLVQIESALQKALETSLKNRVVMKPSFLSLISQQVFYLDHVYNNSRVYTVASKVLGKKF